MFVTFAFYFCEGRHVGIFVDIEPPIFQSVGGSPFFLMGVIYEADFYEEVFHFFGIRDFDVHFLVNS